MTPADQASLVACVDRAFLRDSNTPLG